MSPVLIRLDNEAQFSAPEPAGLPVGEPVPMTRTAVHHDIAGQNVSSGFWECSPGRLRRGVMQAEFSYIIEGKGSFTPEGGETVHFKAGDSLYFAADTHGEWEIVDKVRKTYFIIG